MRKKSICKRIICSVYTIAMITHDISQSTEIVTVIHEFGHFFGALDHYGGILGGTESFNNKYADQGYVFNTNCIYGEVYKNGANTLTELIICDGCRKMIQEALLSLDQA